MQIGTKIAIFKGREIRKILYQNEWWFSVVDVVEVLTDSDNPRDYWYKMKIRDKEESDVELSTICRQLKLIAPDGKLRETDCADTARKALEKRLKRQIVSSGNYLKEKEGHKKIK